MCFVHLSLTSTLSPTTKVILRCEDDTLVADEVAEDAVSVNLRRLVSSRQVDEALTPPPSLLCSCHVHHHEKCAQLKTLPEHGIEVVRRGQLTASSATRLRPVLFLPVVVEAVAMLSSISRRGGCGRPLERLLGRRLLSVGVVPIPLRAGDRAFQ